jgi:hypothetical protein
MAALLIFEVVPMANNHKVMTVRVDQLILSPELSVDYRHVLTSLRYRSNSFSSIPHDILLEFIMAHLRIPAKLNSDSGQREHRSS